MRRKQLVCSSVLLGGWMMLASGVMAAEGLVLVRGEARAAIVVADEATDKVTAAAERLQDFLKRITGISLPISPLSEVKDAGTRILVGPQAARAAGIEIAQTYPGGERVIIRTVGSDIVIAGNDAGAYQNTRYAVDMFLEELGCGWFGPDPNWHVVPKVDELVVDKIAIDISPAFDVRSAFFWQGSHPDFDAPMWGLGGTTFYMNHIYNTLFPEAEYYESHPEYYALVNGKRVAGNAQICFSNPEVLKKVGQMAREHFDRDPNQIMFSLSANDCGGFCECEGCRALGNTPAEQSLAFANTVASELRRTHPDKWVIFYAYWFTHAAPRAMKAVPGVKVMLTNGSCKAHALDNPNCAGKRPWIENYAQWIATGAEVSIYEWYMPSLGGWKHIPHVPGDATLQDLRYYRSKDVWMMYYEGLAAEVREDTPIRWPLSYVAARGMWDLDLTAEQILEPACKLLFGKAADSMLTFYMQCGAYTRACPMHAGNWGLPNPRSVYTPERIAVLSGLLTEAQEKVTADATAVQKRVADVAGCWKRAEEAIAAAEPVTMYEIRTRDCIWYTDKQEVDADYLRALVGINHNVDVCIVANDGPDRTLANGEKLLLDAQRPTLIAPALQD